MSIWVFIARTAGESYVMDDTALFALASSGNDGVDESLDALSIGSCMAWVPGRGGCGCMALAWSASWTPRETNSINWVWLMAFWTVIAPVLLSSSCAWQKCCLKFSHVYSAAGRLIQDVRPLLNAWVFWNSRRAMLIFCSCVRVASAISAIVARSSISIKMVWTGSWG